MSVGDFLHKSRHLRFGAYVLRHADDILSFLLVHGGNQNL